MKNPNGFGSVYKLSGKRRRPFLARKTIGWDENGKQIYETIGYYEKRSEALVALAEYNENPFNLDSSSVTFADLYDKWSEEKFDTVSKSAINGYKASFATCGQLHDIRFVDIKTRHMQEVIKTCGKGYSTLRKIKVLFNQLFKYAMENDIVCKDYSDYVDIGKNTEKSTRKPFTASEIDRLWDVVDKIPLVDSILIMIYTGLRVGELLIIRSSDVDLENGIITGGIKTDAGKDRVIPISPKIYPHVDKLISSGQEYLISKKDGTAYNYSNYYRENFVPIMKKLNMDHKPHDCRHTFATLMTNAKADTISLQKIIGHANYETTANIYTHKDIEELKKAIELI